MPLRQPCASYCLLFSIAMACTPLAAQTTKRERPKVDSGRVAVLVYGSPSWNVDSRKIDEAYLVLRDKATGRLVQIQLEETEPDSAQFTGRFSVNIGEQIVPEIFVPPAHLRQGEASRKQLYDMIQAGKIPRKPMIWKKNVKGQAVMDIYDTRAQAETALRAYEAEQAAARSLRRKKVGKGLTKEQAIGAAQDAERKKQMDKLAFEAAQRESDRIRLEQIEQQKAAQREAALKAMSEKQRAERQARAKISAAEATRLYDAGDFKSAEDRFQEAIELDPENREYQYKYGVTLYRNQKFNEALVALKVAKVPTNVELERDYFMGLVHYRLSELDNSLAKFEHVGKSNDPNLAPSAMFYAGIVYFAQEKYDRSKTCFETVLDNSKDPHLDQQAEEYIERIASAESFKKMRENKFTFMGVIGAMYDSNVLLSPDNSSSSATNSADSRLMTIFDLQYRPVFDEKNEFAPHLMVNLTNSLKTESAKADPFIYTLAAPYSRSGKIGSKGIKTTFTPGYELLYMDPYGTGTKQREQASYYAGADATVMMGKSWVSIYSLEYRNDNSLDVASIGVEDMDATKYTLRTTQVLMLDKKRSLMPTAAYIRNGAKGKNKVYNRMDLGATYVLPMWWETTGSAGLAAYQMKYPNATTSRTDNNYTLTLGMTKPIREWLTWGMTGTYTKNQSNVSANEYTKYMVMTTATIVTNF